jgi:hypothetical protein
MAAMIARYNNLSLALGFPGLIAQGYGSYAMSKPDWSGPVPPVLLLVGTVLLMLGLRYYAIAKGRSGLWWLMGFLGLIGLIVLAVLPDLAKDGKPPAK